MINKGRESLSVFGKTKKGRIILDLIREKGDIGNINFF
jgi:ribosomal protein L34